MEKIIKQIIEQNFSGPFGFCSIEAGQPFLDCRAKIRIPEKACSVIVLAFPYYTGKHEKRNISRYAMIQDYHQVAGAYLNRICQQLSESFPENSFEAFVDNSPLREVSCGQAAGLGVIGDNGLLINHVYGSYIFLGEIVTNLLLNPSVPVGTGCFNCGLCREACPRGALQKNGSVELPLCRSHISQKKSELSEIEQQELIKGGLIWGCDICSDVCPMNKNAKTTPIPEFLNSTVAWLDEEAILNLLDSRAYNYRGKKTILRNYKLLFDSDL